MLKLQTRRRRATTLLPAFVLVVCHLTLVTVCTLAQSQTTGRIAGTIKDANGAAIVGAEVAVKSLATTEERTDTTDADGNYAVTSLSSGTYRVSVTANGFKKGIESVRVVITETVRVDVHLEVGTISEQAIIT